MSFVLDARLEADTALVGDLALSRVLLMNDARYPWFILVPRRLDLIELTDLERGERGVLMDEIAATAAFLRERGRVDKINVGALGNIVRQLHVHVVARRVGDPAWPRPIWGHGMAEPYDAPAQRRLVDEARAALRIG